MSVALIESQIKNACPSFVPVVNWQIVGRKAFEQGFYPDKHWPIQMIRGFRQARRNLMSKAARQAATIEVDF